MRNINSIIQECIKKALNEDQTPTKPIDIYLDLMRFFDNYNRYLKKIYRDKLNKHEALTWEEVDNLNDRIREELDSIMKRQ